MHYLSYAFLQLRGFCVFCIYFVALVAASREAGAAKMNQLQSALKNIACEIELLDEKQTLCERQNAALWYVFIWTGKNILARWLRQTEMLWKHGEQCLSLTPAASCSVSRQLCAAAASLLLQIWFLEPQSLLAAACPPETLISLAGESWLLPGFSLWQGRVFSVNDLCKGMTAKS